MAALAALSARSRSRRVPPEGDDEAGGGFGGLSMVGFLGGAGFPLGAPLCRGGRCCKARRMLQVREMKGARKE